MAYAERILLEKYNFFCVPILGSSGERREAKGKEALETVKTISFISLSFGCYTSLCFYPYIVKTSSTPSPAVNPFAPFVMLFSQSKRSRKSFEGVHIGDRCIKA